MAGGQGRCLPAVGQQVTAPDGGGMRPSAGRRVAAACNGSGRAGEVASGVVRCRCCWVEAGKDERSGFQAFSGSAVSTGSESLSSVSSSPSGISAFIAQQVLWSHVDGLYAWSRHKNPCWQREKMRERRERALHDPPG